jgi:hypothetical protein
MSLKHSAGGINGPRCIGLSKCRLQSVSVMPVVLVKASSGRTNKSWMQAEVRICYCCQTIMSDSAYILVSSFLGIGYPKLGDIRILC